MNNSPRSFSIFQSPHWHCHRVLPSISCRTSISYRRNPSHNSRAASTSASPQKDIIQPQTHYDLFPRTVPLGPPPAGAFEINLSDLKREFLQLQSLAHPDRHGNASKAKAEGASARINEAYTTLLSPLRRAEYILSLHGVEVADESEATDDEDLLIDILEIRERIEEASMQDEIELLKTENGRTMRSCEKDLAKVLEDGDWQAGKKHCAKFRYWAGIQAALNNWEEGKPVMLSH